MQADDQFHVGIVVDDLEGTLASLTDLFGYEWCDEIVVTMPVWMPDGERELTLGFAYSRSVPLVEVVRSIPGTVWEPAAGSGIHHLGYWSDDVADDAARLEAAGHVREAAALNPDGSPFFAYLRAPGGPRIELVDRVARPGMEQYWATGRSPFAG